MCAGIARVERSDAVESGWDLDLVASAEDCDSDCSPELPVAEGWDVVAALMTARDRMVVEMFEYKNSGYMWGWCHACNTWCYDCHLSAGSHAEYADWFSKQTCGECCVHSDWQEVEEWLAAADRDVLEMQDFQGSGYSWGKCISCDCWFDWDHLESKDHLWRVYRKERHHNVNVYYPRNWKDELVHGAF